MAGPEEGVVTVSVIVGPGLTVTVIEPVIDEPLEVPVPDVDVPAVAVTVAVALVFSVVVAIPLSPVTTNDGDTVPLVAAAVPVAPTVNAIGTPGSPFPLASRATAEIVDAPPAAPSVCGFAVMVMLVTAAAPIAI